MKAKDYLKSKGLKNPPLDSGISGGGDAPRIYASDIIEEYARIQIEKDRENSKLLLKQHLQTHVSGYTPCCIEVFKNRPINLD